MKKVSLYIFILLLSACSQEGKKQELGKIVHIDLDRKEDPKVIESFLSGMDIKLLSLETTEESIFKKEASRIYLYNNQFFIVDIIQKIIFHFDENGKFLNKINRNGNGPEEYVAIFDMKIVDGYIYIVDHKKIQQYDLNGNYISSIFLEGRGRQLAITAEKQFVVGSTYKDDYYVNIYKQTGEKDNSYFLSPSILKHDMQFVRTPQYVFKEYNGGVSFSQYFDTSIYYFRSGKIDTLYNFDFALRNMPKDLLEDSPGEKWDKYRMTNIMALTDITITNDWVIFSPDYGIPSIVYYNRRDGSYITNQHFPSPYSLFFGKYNPPHGVENDTYFSLVESYELKDLILDLREQNNILTYPFLQDIDPSMIQDSGDDNAWIVFYKLG